MNSRIPEEWGDILRAVRYITGAEAIVAGGAVRDHYHGKPIRDLDVWVQGPYHISNLGRKPNPEYDLHDRSIMSIYKFYWDEQPVDLITVSRPLHKVVESFSIGLCQFWAAENGVVEGTDLAFRDSLDRMLTCAADASPAYVRKVMGKYPDYGVRV